MTLAASSVHTAVLIGRASLEPRHFAELSASTLCLSRFWETLTCLFECGQGVSSVDMSTSQLTSCPSDDTVW